MCNKSKDKTDDTTPHLPPPPHPAFPFFWGGNVSVHMWGGGGVTYNKADARTEISRHRVPNHPLCLKTLCFIYVGDGRKRLSVTSELGTLVIIRVAASMRLCLKTLCYILYMLWRPYKRYNVRRVVCPSQQSWAPTSSFASMCHCANDAEAKNDE